MEKTRIDEEAKSVVDSEITFGSGQRGSCLDSLGFVPLAETDHPVKRVASDTKFGSGE